LPAAANATLVLDTGTPSGSGLPVVLDGNDYYAAEFSLAAGQTVNSVEAYVMAGMDQPGDTFTIAIYSDAAGFLGARNPTQLYAGQATYQSDGPTGLTGIGWTATSSGNYWVALEVGAADSAIGLSLPTPTTGGTAPALAFAYNSGSGYTTSGAIPFSVQVDASPVPLPASLWLLGSGVLGIGALARRRRAAA
jgi:hypothetical protein